jgi:kynurenine formamidase
LISGTHVDAPFHFCKSGATVDELTLPDLIGPCKVIDISEQCLRNRDYELSVADIEIFERIDGSILNERDIIVIRTG